MGLMDALNIGVRGLAAAQSSIDVTGQNISNANTEGYSRKRADLEASAVVSELYGQKGTGVDVTSINRVRDAFLDRQTWEQAGDLGQTTELDNAYTRLENILREPTENGLAAQMNKFWASWQDLANGPGNPSARESVKATANVLIDTFHNVFKQIEDYGMSMNNPLDQKSKDVNNITNQIYQLNEQVAGTEATGKQKANDTRDKRDLLVRKLAQLIDVQTVEDSHGREIITSGGNLLVGPSEAVQIGTYGINTTLADGTISTELRLKFMASGLAFNPRSGALKGIMDSRGDILTRYKDQLNTLAKTVVTQVNGKHIEGYTLNHATGVYFFDPTKVNAGNIELSASVNSDSNNIAAAKGGKIVEVTSFLPPGGIPAALTPAMDLKTISNAYQNLTQGGVKLTLANGVVLDEGAGKDYIVDYEKGVITFINYAKYNPADPITVKIAYNTTGFSGNGNGLGAADIAEVRFNKSMTPDKQGNLTQSVNEFYSAVIGKMGIEKNQNSSRKDTKTFLIQQMDSEQSSISGVSLDEEMSNMIKFENSYKASAKFIQTVSQMIETLMGIQ